MMDTSNLVYRQLAENDLNQVVALEAASFPTPWTAEQYAVVMRQGGCALFGAFRADELAGYIAIAIHSSTGEMEVYNIAVAETFRCRGVGKKLLRLSLEAAARNGAQLAVLEVRASNAPAIALYQALKFSEVGRRPGYYRDTGEDALVFARSLSLAG